MASEVVDTIVLSGEDSINFANNLFRPSIDFLNSNSQILASIEKNIHITEVTIDVNVDTVFYNNEQQNNGLTWVVNNNDCYGKPEDSGYLSYAA